eukprot:Blabericola_migrator_1__6082@NODE_306_length_10090_cov_155_786691_g250_i0_p1_GENE_NODE_306_length_10090_cov_155_786691_g250_i0NODE_306_length_10090_cov_155_786691_g250_i0_p1_ORF_typecomplete_len1714_score318_10SNF2_N/PF00176_23/2_6e53Helicase_C/PF00271_31/1_6e17Chromo/PF00385_24/1_3e05Chromo/PF00385_24/0_00019Chromo/PF00385_24/2_8e03ResIII/PF04851_15/9_9e13ERCC3_RAD25_C/PF16203_5/2_5e12HDA23/PF11496_8/3_3e03HDA23/PF11496_8/1_3e06DEAD/PF00270_29/0_011DEAD/PF00270_29/1_2e03AAA_11/PF13086_6/1_7AAA_
MEKLSQRSTVGMILSSDEEMPLSRKRRLTAVAPRRSHLFVADNMQPAIPIKRRRLQSVLLESSSDSDVEDCIGRSRLVKLSARRGDEAVAKAEQSSGGLVKKAKVEAVIDDVETVEDMPEDGAKNLLFPSDKPYASIDALRVDRIFGCRMGADDVMTYLVKWEERSYRELCWVRYDTLLEVHDAEVKIAKFHRRNSMVYLAGLNFLAPEFADVNAADTTAISKSKSFIDGGGWRVPRAPIQIPTSERGNFTLFCCIDRVIGYRVERRKVSDILKHYKSYLVKWVLQGYELATWESELVLCGHGHFDQYYGLDIDAGLRSSYEFYFDFNKLKALALQEQKAIERYEQSNMFPKPLSQLKNSRPVMNDGGKTHRMAGFDYHTSATVDAHGSTQLWQVFMKEKLGEGGAYLPSANAEGECRHLLSHQQEGLKWLFYNVEKTSHGSLLADEMGLGKTCQSVVFIQHVLDARRKKGYPHALVVLQKSTLENWKREFAVWAPNLNVIAFSGSKQDRSAVLEWEVKYHKMRDGSIRHDVPNPLRADVVLVTYESARTPEFKKLLPPKHSWTVVVVDECQKVKGGYTSVLRATLDSLPRDNMVLLSGTPVQNTVRELFPLLTLMHPARFSYERETAEYTEASFLAQFGDIQTRDDCVELTERLQTLLRPYILRREKSQVLQALPPKQVKLIKVPLTLIQKKVYQALYRRTAKLRVNNLQMQLRKVCIHPFMVESIEELIMAGKFGPLKYKMLEASELAEDAVETPGGTAAKQAVSAPLSQDHSEHTASTQSGETTPISETYSVQTSGQSVPATESNRSMDPLVQREIQTLVQCSGKFVLIDKMLRAYRERGQKVLIFSFFKTALDLVQYYAELMEWAVERIDGDTSGEERQICIDRFNTDPERFIFLCTTRAGGLGINLTSASVVIHLDSDYNPQHDLQAQARCHRIGQSRDVEVYHLVAEDTYENYILFDVAGRKLGLEQVLLGRLQADTGAVASQRKKLNKLQEEVALKKGVYAALRDDARTAEDEDSFANLSIESILAQRTELVDAEDSTNANAAAAKLPSAFSTARFGEAPGEDEDKSGFWDEVQSKLEAMQQEGEPDIQVDGAWSLKSSEEASNLRSLRRLRGEPSHKQIHIHSDSSANSSDGEDISAEGKEEVKENAEEKAATLPLGAVAKKSARSGTRRRATVAEATVVSNLTDGASGSGAATTPSKPVSAPRKRRSRVSSGMADESKLVPPVDPKMLASAIQLTATITQPSDQATQDIANRLRSRGLESLAAVWEENVRLRHSVSPLGPAVDVASQGRVYELVYRCLCGIEAWTQTPFGSANGIKSDHLRWLDQFSTWGILCLPDNTLRVLEGSCKPQDAAHSVSFRVPQATLTFLKEILGALTSWVASCAAWEEGRVHFNELMCEEYAKRAASDSTLSTEGHEWYEHGIVTEEMVANVLSPLTQRVFGSQIGHREGASRRQTWIPAEDLVAKFVFLHLCIGRDLSPEISWPPPSDEVDWSLVSQVVGRVSRLADGPERRRDAVVNRYYNRLDSRWNEEPFYDNEKAQLMLGLQSKAQPASIAKTMERRNLEKVKKGLRCIQLQIAAEERKRRSSGGATTSAIATEAHPLGLPRETALIDETEIVELAAAEPSMEHVGSPPLKQKSFLSMEQESQSMMMDQLTEPLDSMTDVSIIEQLADPSMMDQLTEPSMMEQLTELPVDHENWSLQENIV